MSLAWTIAEVCEFTQTPDGQNDGHGSIDSAPDPKQEYLLCGVCLASLVSIRHIHWSKGIENSKKKEQNTTVFSHDWLKGKIAYIN